MAKPELGQKRVCVACGARFYDLLRAPAQCPKCGTEQPPDQPRTRRASGNVSESRAAKKVAAVVADDPDVEVEVAEDETEEDVLEDSADLEDDADAIIPEVEVEGDSDETER